MLPQRLGDEATLDIKPQDTAAAAQLTVTRDDLQNYGKAQRREVDQIPICAMSSVTIPKATPLKQLDFFREKFPGDAIAGIMFPNKEKAFNIDMIAIDPVINFDLGKTTGETPTDVVDEQLNLRKLAGYLRNSLFQLRVGGADNLEIPLSELVTFAIEYNGDKWTRRMVRNGYKLNNSLKIGSDTRFTATIISAEGYYTHNETVNPLPEPENQINLKLFGFSLGLPVGN